MFWKEYQCELEKNIVLKTVIFVLYFQPNEDFYTCCWSRSSTNKTSILLAAGGRGIIRIFHPENSEIPAKHLIGHGQSVNQLKIAHSKPFLLASASKDHSIRLWNIETSVCIATFHGIDSHRDECVSIDFNRKCTQLVSGGNDHMIAIWDLTQSNIAHAIETSQSYNEKTSQHSFKTIFQSFPIFTTRSIHRNYIDCVQWFNNAIFSKVKFCCYFCFFFLAKLIIILIAWIEIISSIFVFWLHLQSNEDDLICWQPGLLPSDQINGKSSRDSFTRFAKLDVECCTYYFVRFAINFQQTLLAIGDSIGIIRLFNLNVNDPTNIPFVTLKHPKCKQIIRDLAFSRCGRDLICCSDDGTIWLHQLRTNRK